MSQEASGTTAEPIIFDLDTQQSLRLQQLYAASPGVFLHHQGHTHRNKRSSSPLTPGVTYQEVCATKEYPGGFHLLRVHSGGYALNFYKTRSDLAREWSERTRQEIFATYPSYTFGTAADRNSVFDADFSGLGSAAHSGSQAQPSPRSAGGPRGSRPQRLPATGGLPAAVPAGAALTAAAAAAVRRRQPEPGSS